MTETEAKLTALLKKQNEGLKTLKNENDSLREQLSQAQADNTNLKQKNQQQAREIADLKNNLNDYQENFANALNELKEKESALQEKNRQELNEQKRAQERSNEDWRIKTKESIQESVKKQYEKWEKELADKDEQKQKAIAMQTASGMGMIIDFIINAVFDFFLWLVCGVFPAVFVLALYYLAITKGYPFFWGFNDVAPVIAWFEIGLSTLVLCLGGYLLYFVAKMLLDWLKAKSNPCHWFGGQRWE